MKKILASILLVSILPACLIRLQAARVEYLPEPSDRAIIPAARNVYKYLIDRRDATTNKMIEGQFLGMINQVWYPNQSFYGYFDIDQHAIEGKLPAMGGTRYDGEDKKTKQYVLNDEICHDINTKLIESWHKAHPILHITATPPNPWDRQLGREPDDSAIQKINILLRANTTVTPEEALIRDIFWADIDIIARGLQELEDLGIPVLFRPFAEFNMSAKYYFDRQSSDDFKALWKEVYRYYVNEPTDAIPGKGLHHLLFCWEVWALGRNETSSIIAPWYPGSSFVDVVAGAYYFKPETEIDYLDDVTGEFSFENSNPYDEPIYSYLTGKNRPFGAAQYGLNQDTKPPVPGDHDFTLKFMEYVGDDGQLNPMAFALYWNQFQAVERQGSKETFVADPRIATHDDLPGFFPAALTLNALAQTYDGTPRMVTVTTDPTGLNVNLTYDGGTIAPTAAGSYSVSATLAPSHYIAEPAVGTLVIAKAPQTINFTQPASFYYGQTAPTLVAEITSGRSTVFSIVSGDAQVTGNTFTYSSVGSITIEANEDGDTNHEPAPSVQRSLEIFPSFYSWVENEGEPLDDANNDGISNLLAYGLGLSPVDQAWPTSSEFTPGLPSLTLSGGTLSLEFVIDSSRTDITVSTEESTDLLHWSDVPHTVIDTLDDLQRCRAESATEPGVQKFMRLRVLQNFTAP